MGKKEDDGKPKPPKKALSAFFLFRQEVYDQVKGENPEAGITKITQIISEKWKTVSEDTKARLEVKYQEEKVRVAKEKEQYEEKYGKIERKKKKKIKKEKSEEVDE